MHYENCSAALQDDSKFCDSCGACTNSATPPSVSSFEPLTNNRTERKTILIMALLGGLIVMAVIALAIAPSGSVRSILQAWTRGDEHLTPQQMVEQINGFCHDLNVMADARQISTLEALNFCSMHSTYAAIALSSEPDNLRTFYESARDDYRAIKRRGGTNPNVTRR